jgi:hypothetical protein
MLLVAGGDFGEQSHSRSTSMTANSVLVSALRARIAVGVSDARRALVASGGDLERAYALLREEGIGELRRRTGAEASLAGNVFDEVSGDVERATVRLSHLVGPPASSATICVLDEGSSDERRGRDLHALIGGFDGDHSPRDTVFLAVDLFAQIEADGLDAFIQNIGVANLELVAAALERIDVSQAAEIVRTAGAAASPLAAPTSTSRGARSPTAPRPRRA